MKTLLNLTRTVLCGGLAALAWAQPAAATSLALTKTFEGNINFAGTQASLQSKAGGAKVCDLATSAQASIALPKEAGIVSATLYWAGTGAIDGEVSMNGTAVSAPANRRYGSSIDGFTYFAAAAEVTSLVQGKTSFTFSGLTVDTSDTYCSKKQKENSMVAGFALVVVYAHKDERYRTVNIYEGLQAIKYASVTVKMPDYTPPADNAGSGRFGYIVWEGDKTGNQKGDEVRFAGELLRAEPFIQKQNAFNSKSGANSDENSMGIDFDVVDLPAPPARPVDANAVFTTESDRVLLGTAIVALPSKPADLAIKKTQLGEFKLGNEITYTLTVSNLGTRSDSKVEVTDTLPAALTYVSAGGSDWTCRVAGQTVSCAYGQALAPGASASVQIKARINAEGKIANTAEVKGTGDGVPGNNTSTVEGDTGGGQPVNLDPYVFTVGACKPNEEIKASGSGCALFAGPVVAGSKPVIYLTRADKGIAKPFSTTASTTANLRYSLECNNPAQTAGTTASYGVALSTCVPHDTPLSAGTGAAATPVFAANVVSKEAEFHYPDVGMVTLRVRDAAGNIGKVSFASVPASIKSVIKRTDGVLNPASSTLEQPGFAEAGEPFLVEVSAYGQENIGPLRNFGNESGEFALTARLRVLAKGGDVEQKMLAPQNDWSGTGSVLRSFAWNEAGVAKLGITLDYLGIKTLENDHPVVGRFYPQYFKTETEKGFGCLKRMNCPAGAPHLISRAVYSGQPFTVTVTAYGRNGNALQRFDEALVPAISLIAVSAPGADGKPPGTFVNGEGKPVAAREDLRFQLEVGYDAEAATRGWTAPTAVHVRATASELRKTAGGDMPVTISSLREKGILSVEGGIMVVNGRLMVNNVVGTPLAKTPVPLHAQFWSGQAWEHNGGLEQDTAVLGKVRFSACRRSLRASITGECDPSIKVFGSGAAGSTVTLPLLKEGKASLVLAPLTADKSGTVDLFIDAKESLPYLPSTVGRVSFGQFKSPVIYVREMY